MTLDILAKAQEFLALFEKGRAGLESIASSLTDGSAAIGATTLDELNAMLIKEREESQAAHDNLQNAINASRA
jgi:hypothetical protein